MKTKTKRACQLFLVLLITISGLIFATPQLAHAFNITCTWTGDDSSNSTDVNDGSNWAGAGCGSGLDTTDNYTLIFPVTASGYTVTDEVLSNINVANIEFQGPGYTFSAGNGNTITLTGNISDSANGGASNEINANLILQGTSESLSGTTNNGNGYNELILGATNNTLNMGTANVTLANVSLEEAISGSGSLTINDSSYPGDSGVDITGSNSSYTGPVTVSSGALFADSSSALSEASSLTIGSEGILKGNGTVSSATIQSGGTIAPGHSPGCLSATSLSISGTADAQIGGTAPCTDYDQINVSNTINVTGATLNVEEVNGYAPTLGQQFEIINNTSSNPITGTFSGLPEGTIFNSGSTYYKITYVGGDGNDVVLTVVNAPATSSSGSSSNSAPKAPNTGLASLESNPLTVFFVTIISSIVLLAISKSFKKKTT